MTTNTIFEIKKIIAATKGTVIKGVCLLVIMVLVMACCTACGDKSENLGKENIIEIESENSTVSLSAVSQDVEVSNDAILEIDTEPTEIEYDENVPEDDPRYLSDEEIEEILSEYSGFAGIYSEEENEEWARRYPINIYRCSSLRGNSEFEDMDIVEWTMMFNDDWMHIVPYFHEYLDYDSDVYLCYVDTHKYEGLIYESTYLFTTDEGRVRRYEMGEIDINEVVATWGWLQVKWEPLNDGRMFFHLVREEDGTTTDFSDSDWIEY